MQLLESIRVFSRIVEAGSLSAVARELGTSQSRISKLLADLEAHLGVRLIHRTTHSLSLTEEGRVLYDHALAVLHALHTLETSVGKGARTPAGLIKLGSPVAFGRLQVATRLKEFLVRYPEVKVELMLSDSFLDIVEHGMDVSIRVGEVTDPDLVARRIGVTRRVTVASPEYLAQRGEPSTPDELRNHNCIVYTQLATNDEWHFSSRAGALVVRVSGNYSTNSSEAVREGVLTGIGIAVTPLWLFHDEIARGAIKVLLRDFEPKPLPIHAVYSSRKHLPSRVRALIDFLSEQFQASPILAEDGKTRVPAAERPAVSAR
jgi:DNA-binding transcriptional LysR family regulator